MLNGKTAIVTGSTSGIGLSNAKALAEAGSNIILNGFGNADEIEKLRLGLESGHGVRALYHGADMSKPSEIASMAQPPSSARSIFW
jgi:3-hydroxybutyrate dehydrogenase